MITGIRWGGWRICCRIEGERDEVMRVCGIRGAFWGIPWRNQDSDTYIGRFALHRRRFGVSIHSSECRFEFCT